MEERKELLERLLKFEKPIEPTKAALAKFPWDSDIELVFLSASHFLNLFKRYLNGNVTADEVENWANAIEGRDDVGFVAGNKKVLREIIHELANPLLTQPLTKKRVEEFQNQLESKML